MIWRPLILTSFRIVVVSICVSITVYHGQRCTQKFLSGVSTVNEETVKFDETISIQWSFCKEFKVKSCKNEKPDDEWVVEDGFLTALFEEVTDDEIENYCEESTIPNHANSSKEFWGTLEKREHFKLDQLLTKIDIWNKSSNAWEEIYLNDGLFRNGTYNSEVLFRY